MYICGVKCGLFCYCIEYFRVLLQYAKTGSHLWCVAGDQLPGGVCAAGDHLSQDTEENQNPEKETRSATVG